MSKENDKSRADFNEWLGNLTKQNSIDNDDKCEKCRCENGNCCKVLKKFIDFTESLKKDEKKKLTEVEKQWLCSETLPSPDEERF